jgi:hypothetical protein
MSFLGRMWARLRGKEGDPTMGTEIAVLGGAAAAVETQTDDESSADESSADAAPDYGWSGDHLSSGSDFGGGGGLDGGGAGADGGGGGGL